MSVPLYDRDTPTEARASRCTYRKHVIENGATFCDCEQLMVGLTVAKNAQVVTLLVANDVERGALARRFGGREQP